MPSFNLITEKWIPCIMGDGNNDEKGLLEVLVKAPEIKEIFDPSPLITVALHRLLLAILHRNFGPANLEEWKTLWNRGRWDDTKLSNYFGKWRHRFDLFDENRPFYQTPELKKAEKHPVLHLAMEASSGNNATLFDHNIDSRPNAIAPAIAARYIIATQAFAIGFGKSSPFYFSDSTLIRGMTILTLGNTLFETLALNLIVYNKERPFTCTGKDAPVWEQDQPAQPDKNGTLISGYLDYLTWQSRQIHLRPEGNKGFVRYCHIQQNLKLPVQEPFDPFKCYNKSEKRGHYPLNISKDKAVWRDSHVLFQTVDQNYKRPEIFNFLSRIEFQRREGEIKTQPAYRFIVTGLATDEGKAASILLWRHERLPLPLIYLEDEKLLAKLKEALDVAEDVGKLLKKSIWYLSRPIFSPNDTKKPNKEQSKEINKFIEHLAPTRPYWSQLGRSFNYLLNSLSEDRTEIDGEIIYGLNALPRWKKEVRKAALEAFENTTRGFDRSARMLKAITRAEQNFKYNLRAIIKLD